MFNRLADFSIATDIRHYMSSILQFLVPYFIRRKLVGYFGFGEKNGLECTKYSIFPTFSGESP